MERTRLSGSFACRRTETNNKKKVLINIKTRFLGLLSIFMESALKFPLLLFSKGIRAVYHKLPMTAEGKSQMKSFVYENFSFLVKGTKSYQHWLMMRSAFDQPE